MTKSPAALVTYLQPAAHIIKSLLECNPQLRAGLSQGYQAWEWCKRVLVKADLRDRLMHAEERNYVFLTGDFESATDNLEHEIAYEVC